MKYAGALMIFLACAGGGIYRAMLIKKRVRTLAALSGALELMKGEIQSRLADLPSALNTVRGAALGEAARFFEALCSKTGLIGDEPFSDIWRECATDRLAILNESELNAVIGLGGVLGRYDADTQARAIDGCRDILNGAYELSAASAPSVMRAVVGAGVSIGLMITITLI